MAAADVVSSEEKKAREKMLLLNHTASDPMERSVRKRDEERSGLVAAVPTIRRHHQSIQMHRPSSITTRSLTEGLTD